MTQAISSVMSGVEISTAELIRARPNPANGGFAPGGRVFAHLWGSNRSVFFGRGMEYAESRGYQPGDDLRTIDWRLTARSAKVHTKLYHEERERPVHILLDQRESMRFGTRKRFKSHLAAELAAMLAWVGLDGGDRVGGMILTDAGHREFAPSRTRAALLAMLATISDSTRGTEGAGLPLEAALTRFQNAIRPGALAFVISDFAEFGPGSARALQRLSGRSHLTLISVSDPMEAKLPERGGRIGDGQSSLPLFGLGRRAKADHAERFARRQAELRGLGRRLGVGVIEMQTTDDAATLLRKVAR